MPNWIDFKATIIGSDTIYQKLLKKYNEDPRVALDIGNKGLYNPDIQKYNESIILLGEVKWEYTYENFKDFVKYILDMENNKDNIHIKIHCKDAPNNTYDVYEFVNHTYIHKYTQESIEIE